MTPASGAWSGSATTRPSGVPVATVATEALKPEAFKRETFKPEAPTTPSSVTHVVSSRPSVATLNALAQLEQRLGTAQVELRKLGSERHALRARMRRETDRVHELESALRAEKELRRQVSDEHQAALASLRARLGLLEAAEARSSDLERRLSDSAQALAAKELQLAALAEERSSVLDASGPRPLSVTAVRASKPVEGLRRVRGIGPGYQRALEGLGITELEQIGAWTSDDIQAYAEKLKIRPDRIVKDDWVGQAKRLLTEG